MKMQSIIMIVVVSFCYSMVHGAEFSLITNETKYPIDVYHFKDLDSICFAGAKPVVCLDAPTVIIPLSDKTKPRVTECCFHGPTPFMSAILPHESRQVSAYDRIVLKYSVKTVNGSKAMYCFRWFPGSGTFSYQMTETKPGVHYIIQEPEEKHPRT